MQSLEDGSYFFYDTTNYWAGIQMFQWPRYSIRIAYLWISVVGAVISFIGLASSRLHGQEFADTQEGTSGSERALRIQYDLVYGAQNEPMHRADVYRPVENPDAKLPAVLMIHGGAWSLGDKTNDRLHAKRLAQMGFVVVAINYRLAPMHKFPAQVDDCYQAVEWLVQAERDFGIDRDRIGAWGYSAGGHLAAMIATQPKSGLPRIKACVVGAAPCDLTVIPPSSQLLRGFLGGTRSEFPERYRDASPVTFVTPDDPPMFLFHGDRDALVPQNSTVAMTEALKRNGVPFEYEVVAGKAHLTTFINHDITEKSFQFLKEKLIESNR